MKLLSQELSLISQALILLRRGQRRGLGALKIGLKKFFFVSEGRHAIRLNLDLFLGLSKFFSSPFELLNRGFVFSFESTQLESHGLIV